MDTFVGRDNPVHSIREELSDLRLHAHVRILSISVLAGSGRPFSSTTHYLNWIFQISATCLFESMATPARPPWPTSLSVI